MCPVAVESQAQKDTALVRRIKNGDEDAFQVLLAGYERLIMARAASYHNAGLEADDLFQEGMIGLISAIRTYNPDGGASFKTYAMLCINRKMVSALRSALSQKQIPLNSYLSLNDQVLVHDSAFTIYFNPEDMVESREAIGIIKEVMKTHFSSLERRVLNLYVSGLSYAAMAKILNVSTKFIDNALQRIKRKLSLKVSG